MKDTKQKLLIIAMASLLCACSSGNASGSGAIDEGFDGNTTVKGHQTYYAQRERTHIGAYDIKDTDIVFAENGLSEYSFLIASDSDSVSAKFASFVQGHVNSAVGATIDIVYGIYASTTEKRIVVNNLDLMRQEGVEIDTSLALKHGYTFTRKGNAVFVYAPNSECAQLAGIKFANAVVGYDCLGNSTYIYSKNGKKLSVGDKVMLPDFNLKEIPDGQTRVRGPSISESDRNDMGFSEISDLIPIEGMTWHNCLNVLPVSKYGTEHGDWYSNDRTQVCYTAHGNAAELDAMASTVEEAIVKAVQNPIYKDYYRTGFFQSDGAALCSCDACSASAAYYGDGDKGLTPAHSAAMIKFINLVADKYYNDDRIKGTDREDVNLGIFGYQDSCQAPISHIEDVKVNDKVTIYLAPSRIGGVTVSWTEPLLPDYGGIQKVMYENLLNWSKISSNLGFWGYSTLFQNYTIPFATYSSLVEDARVAYDCGAKWIEFQNEFNHEGHTGFTMFKSYINSKTLIDVNTEYDDIKDTYFSNFYDQAGKYMLQYFNELEEINRMHRLSGLITGYLGQVFSDPTVLYSFESVMHFANLVEKSLDAIAYLDSSDSSTYAKFKKNIEYEAVFPLYFLTVYYESKLDSELTAKYRKMLYQACSDTKFTYFNEDAGGAGESLFTTLFKNWGF